jgi:flagellar biosynthetic protein FliP
MGTKRVFWGVAIMAALVSVPALGQEIPLAKAVSSGGATNYSLSIETMLMLTGLTLLPTALLMMTGFTRIVIVMSLLRQAIGTASVPPNQVVIGISLVLTFFVMGPTFDKMYEEAYKPYSAKKMSGIEAIDKGAESLKQFMMKQTRNDDLSLFSKIADVKLTTPESVPMRVLMPAFVTSELKTAFQIGFMVFVPFVIIDLIVASILMSMGMMMVPPAMIALPLKMLVFVLADGWAILMGSLVESFR